MIIRLRSPNGQFRVEVQDNESQAVLMERIAKTIGSKSQPFTLARDEKHTQLLNIDGNKPVGDLRLQNGVILYTSFKEQHVKPPAQPTTKYIKQHPIDEKLLKTDGTIKRSRNPQFCKHGDNSMCEYCLPLQPYDTTYLEENKIKYMSFHAYQRQILEREKIPPVSSDKFIPPLSVPSYTLIDPCPSNSHGKYPLGICSKCQPSAITLQTQNFRMVDHVEFESPAVIDNFISYWRASGVQRVGYMFGKYDLYDKVPLGVKAIVSAIYEPPQESGHDYIQLLDHDMSGVVDLARDLGLEVVGVIFTDLFDDGTGKGGVLCKRHAKSYFLSSAEIIFSAKLQSNNPVKTPYSPTGQFGSRFVTCVISGNTKHQIDIESYQVSNSAQSMTKDHIIEASTEPSLMRVRTSSNTNYIPDVFFKYRNEYNLMVQEAAQPTFPLSHGFPSTTSPLFNADASFIANRGAMGTIRNLGQVAKVVHSGNPLLETFANFHLLLFLKESGVLDGDTLGVLCTAISTKSEIHAQQVVNMSGWDTLNMVLEESKSGQDKSGEAWSCRHCTFVNVAGENCEMCGLPKE